jgi:hypothetical protein
MVWQLLTYIEPTIPWTGLQPLLALQILWWEFPPEHWTDLREGSRMNFSSPPLSSTIHDNAPMDVSAMEVAGAFVDELDDLGVLLAEDDQVKILLNAPLFCIPKEGQPGEWRAIADMLRGGQNSNMMSDPVYLPCTTHILSQMYTGGYTAVVNASKFFYQFKTHPQDQPYLGLIHPITGVRYAYGGLPMGAGNSPALVGRYGLSFLRLLRERFSVFQGAAKANCWWTGFDETGKYDPELGYGYVLTSKDGPAVKLFVHVDDFCLHGPTYEKTAAALKFFLDKAVDVGLLCHPKKLTPPLQIVKYCGFILDSRRIPCMRIPVAKRERALAIVEHLLEANPDREFSQLSLAIAAGVLQSLVEATLLRLGHTYLRRFHSLLRLPGLGSGIEPYYTRTKVTSLVKKDLLWWRCFLLHEDGRYARSENSSVLIPNWGNGSGTGTGGTHNLPNQPLHMWK